LGVGLTTPHRKKIVVECCKGPRTWTDSLAGFCEFYNEPSGSIKKQDIFDKMSDYQLFKCPAPWSMEQYDVMNIPLQEISSNSYVGQKDDDKCLAV
jgi:hypothetical protein